MSTVERNITSEGLATLLGEQTAHVASWFDMQKEQLTTQLNQFEEVAQVEMLAELKRLWPEVEATDLTSFIKLIKSSIATTSMEAEHLGCIARVEVALAEIQNIKTNLIIVHHLHEFFTNEIRFIENMQKLHSYFAPFDDPTVISRFSPFQQHVIREYRENLAALLSAYQRLNIHNLIAASESPQEELMQNVTSLLHDERFSHYIENFKRLISNYETLQVIAEHSPLFKETFPQNISFYAIQPTQHVMRYPLQFEAIVTKCATVANKTEIMATAAVREDSAADRASPISIESDASSASALSYSSALSAYEGFKEIAKECNNIITPELQLDRKRRLSDEARGGNFGRKGKQLWKEFQAEAFRSTLENKIPLRLFIESYGQDFKIGKIRRNFEDLLSKIDRGSLDYLKGKIILNSAQSSQAQLMCRLFDYLAKGEINYEELYHIETLLTESARPFFTDILEYQAQVSHLNHSLEQLKQYYHAQEVTSSNVVIIRLHQARNQIIQIIQKTLTGEKTQIGAHDEINELITRTCEASEITKEKLLNDSHAPLSLDQLLKNFLAMDLSAAKVIAPEIMHKNVAYEPLTSRNTRYVSLPLSRIRMGDETSKELMHKLNERIEYYEGKRQKESRRNDYEAKYQVACALRACLRGNLSWPDVYTVMNDNPHWGKNGSLSKLFTQAIKMKPCRSPQEREVVNILTLNLKNSEGHSYRSVQVFEDMLIAGQGYNITNLRAIKGAFIRESHDLDADARTEMIEIFDKHILNQERLAKVRVEVEKLHQAYHARSGTNERMIAKRNLVDTLKAYFDKPSPEAMNAIKEAIESNPLATSERLGWGRAHKLRHLLETMNQCNFNHLHPRIPLTAETDQYIKHLPKGLSDDINAVAQKLNHQIAYYQAKCRQEGLSDVDHQKYRAKLNVAEITLEYLFGKCSWVAVQATKDRCKEWKAQGGGLHVRNVLAGVHLPGLLEDAKKAKSRTLREMAFRTVRELKEKYNEPQYHAAMNVLHQAVFTLSPSQIAYRPKVATQEEIRAFYGTYVGPVQSKAKSTVLREYKARVESQDLPYMAKRTAKKLLDKLIAGHETIEKAKEEAASFIEKYRTLDKTEAYSTNRALFEVTKAMCNYLETPNTHSYQTFINTLVLQSRFQEDKKLKRLVSKVIDLDMSLVQEIPMDFDSAMQDRVVANSQIHAAASKRDGSETTRQDDGRRSMDRDSRRTSAAANSFFRSRSGSASDTSAEATEASTVTAEVADMTAAAAEAAATKCGR